MTKKPTHITVELKDNYTLVKVFKDLDAELAIEARNVFSHIVEHADRDVKLDLELSKKIDSSGIGAIAFLYKRLKSLDFNLELMGLSKQTLSLIQSLNINDIIPSNIKDT